MATIGTFHKQADGSYTGAIKTLSLNVKQAQLKPVDKESENAPDFRIFAGEVSRLGGGGVYLNVGSAVLLPEVFLKAVTAARNLGHDLSDFATASLDFIQSYRPNTNVVQRPTKGVGRGYSLTGHHELLVPLLAAALVEGARP